MKGHVVDVHDLVFIFLDSFGLVPVYSNVIIIFRVASKINSEFDSLVIASLSK